MFTLCKMALVSRTQNSCFRSGMGLPGAVHWQSVWQLWRHKDSISTDIRDR